VSPFALALIPWPTLRSQDDDVPVERTASPKRRAAAHSPPRAAQVAVMWVLLHSLSLL
jgi:hypothetical protein